MTGTGRVACLAGRRVDETGASEPRFPLANVAQVRTAIESVLIGEGISELVSSAACGADLLALEICAARHIPATIVLPFDTARFRKVSVTDRPGDWGRIFDRVMARTIAAGSCIDLHLAVDDPSAFGQANVEIIRRAAARHAAEHLAILVWDGTSRGADDATADVRHRAQQHGFRVVEISTLSGE